MKPVTLLLFLGTWLAYMQFHPGHPLTVDSMVTLDTVRAMAQGSLAIPKTMVTRQGRNGQQYSLYGPLLPLVSLPAYKVASWLEGQSSEPGTAQITRADYVALGTNQWISALIVVLLFTTALCWGTPFYWALGVSVAAAFTTMLLPYSRDFFTQPLVALCVFSAFRLLLFTRNAGSRAGLAWASLMIGAAVLTRMDMIVILPGFLLCGFHALRKMDSGVTWRDIGLLLIPLLACLLGLIVFDWYRWGIWFFSPYSSLPFTTPLIDSLPRFIYSHDLSVFLFNPLLIPSMVLMVYTWREAWWLWSGILVSDICYLILVASYVDYHGGICPGPRYLLALMPLNLMPLLLGLGMPGMRTLVTGMVLAVCGVAGLMMNGYAAWVDYTQAVPAWTFWSGVISNWLGVGTEFSKLTNLVPLC